MSGNILVSTAYLPPIEYISLISGAGNIVLEQHENYLKQTYRNRCYILSSSGLQILSVPILLGSIHKVRVKDVRIDYSKRWQQVHLRTIIASYGSSPYFQYYYDLINDSLMKHYEFLFDLNIDLTEAILKILKLKCSITVSTHFELLSGNKNDFRYKISPKIKSDFKIKPYTHVFNTENSHSHGLSVLDLIFNTGPEAVDYL